MALKQHLASRGQGQGGPGGATPPFQPSTTQGGQGGRGTLPMPTPGQGGGQPGATPSGGGPPSSSGQMVSAIDPTGTKAYEGFQGLAGLLQQWTSRKSEKEHVEAANIAQKLRKAMDDNDVATVHEILNDKNATKVLNKVYKGWLTKSQEAQKPGKEPDPAVSGFEKGVTDYEKGKAQQPPKGGRTEGGYLLPQGGPAQQASSNIAQTAAITTGQDLERAQRGEPTLAQKAEQEKYKAEEEKYQAQAQKAIQDYKKAQLEVQKTQTELQIKQTEVQASKEKGKVSADIEQKRYLKSVVDLDIQKQILQNTIMKGKMSQQHKQTLTAANKLKLAAVDKAITIVSKIQDEKRGFSASDFSGLSTELKAAGATNLIKALPEHWYSALFAGKDSVLDTLEALQQYKESLQKAFLDDEAPSKAKADEGDDSDPTPEGTVGTKTGPDGKEHYVDKDDNDLGTVGSEGEGE